VKRLLPFFLVASLVGCTSVESAPKQLVIDIPESKQQIFSGVIDQFESDTGATVFLVDSQANSEPAQADLLYTDTTRLSGLIEQGLITAIDQGTAGGLLAGAVETFSRDGQLFGIPFSFETVSLVCHRELVSSQPASWEELTESGYSPTYTPGNAFETLFYLSGFQNMKSTVSNFVLDETLAKDLSGWLRSQKSVFSVADYSEVVQDFTDKKSSCLIAGPWMAGALSEFDLVAIKLPKTREVEPLAPALSLGLSLSGSSTNPDLAKRFLKLLASQEAQREIYELTGVLPATSAFSSELENPLLRALLQSPAPVFPLPDLSGAFVELTALEQLITDSLSSDLSSQDIYARYLKKLGE
jgi:arabinogalactan oligomer/maltooligosaccharide transport system substrate-binding protein